MDNKENIIKSTADETTTIKSGGLPRRSSILKQPKIKNETKSIISVRRVSFSSNYIKQFTTDTEKNTIWDTTVEELLSAAESSNSRELRDSRGNDLNTTVFDEDVDITGSDDVLISDANEPRNILDTSTFLELSCLSPTIENTFKSENPADTSASMDFTCVNPTLEMNSAPSENPADNSTSMEFTCVNPTLQINPTKSVNPADNSASMEFTCVNPTLQINPVKSVNPADNSASMEFTCVNPTLQINSAKSVNPADNSASMEFTCVNPTLQMNPAKSVNPADNSASMEFTCVNPTLQINAAKTGNTADNSASMEFTCVNHTLQINPDKSVNPADNSASMEFTCVNPTLQINSAKTGNPADNSASMEFTCVNPTLQINPAKSVNPADNSASMEFTCVNPTVQINSAKSLNSADTSLSMEFTCVNPPLHTNFAEFANPTEPKKPADTSVTMEFTCVNPTLHPTTVKSENRADPAEIGKPENPAETSMEFTCAYPTLCPGTAELEDKAGFTESANLAEIDEPADSSVSMVFTCAYPTLCQNAAKSADTTKSANPAKAEKPENSADTSVSMEFTCVNPTLSKYSAVNKGTSDEESPGCNEFTNDEMIKSTQSKNANSNNGKSATLSLKTPPTKFEPFVLDKSNTSEYIRRNYLDKTDLSNMSTLDCSKGISLIKNVAQTSTISNVSLQVEKDQTVDLPSMNLPDITNSSIYPASRISVDVGNEAVDLPSLNFTEVKKSVGEIPNVNMDSSDSKSHQFSSRTPTINIDINNGKRETLSLKKPATKFEPSVSKKTNTSEYIRRNYLDKTDLSNMSTLDCSKGISLIKNVAQTSTISNVSLQVEKDQTVDLPSMNIPDITDSSIYPASRISVDGGNKTVDLPSLNFTEVKKSVGEIPKIDMDCSDSKSLQFRSRINIDSNNEKSAILSSKKPATKFEPSVLDKSNTSEYIRRNYLDKTDLSDMSTLDCSKGISLIKSVAQTSTISNVSLQIEKDKTVDLPSMNLPDITNSSIYAASRVSVDVGKVVDLPSLNFTEVNKSVGEIPKVDMDCSDSKSVLHTETSKSSMIDLLSSNIDFSTLSNVDDTQQLLRDASQLKRSKIVSCSENSLNTTSGYHMNRTYVIQENYKSEDRNCDVEEKKSFESEKIQPDVDEKDAITDEKMQEAQLEEHTDVFVKCAEITEDNFILDRSSIELIENSADESLILANNNSKEQVDASVHSKRDVRDETAVKKTAPNLGISENHFSPSEFMAMRKRDLLILEKKLESEVIDSNLPNCDWRENLPCLKKLKEQLEQNRKIIVEKYDVFKKKLEHVLETCQKNQFVPEKLSEDEEVVENDELENILPAKRGIVEKIEEKSKICDKSWKMIKVDDGVAQFTTFFEQIELSVEYCQKDYRVRSFETKSLLTDKAKPTGKLIQKEFLRLLTPTHIHNSIGRNYNILSLLDYIQMVMEKIRKCYKTLKEFEAIYDLKISEEYKVNFFMLDEDLLVKWDFSVDLSDLERITKDSVGVSASIGKVNAKHVLDLVSECPKGLEFMMNFVTKVKEYMETLKKRQRMIGFKRMERVE